MYEERNRKIKESCKATRERRSQMDCRVFSVKIQENRLSRAKEEKLNRCFLEAKRLVLNIDTISKKVINLCEKTKDEFIEEFRVNRPNKAEEFNLIIYNVEVGSANSYGDSWYLDVYTNKLETELTADNYNKEELCEILDKKHKVFLKQVTDIVFNIEEI